MATYLRTTYTLGRQAGKSITAADGEGRGRVVRGSVHQQSHQRPRFTNRDRDEFQMKVFLRRLLPRPLHKRWVNFRYWLAGRTLRQVERLGVNPSLKEDLYSPLPVHENLLRHESRWNRPSDLRGLRYNLDEMGVRMDSLLERHLPAFQCVMDRCMELAGYTWVDGLFLFLILQELRPKRYFEIGSGSSTFIANLAREVYGVERTRITAVDPYPPDRLFTIPGIEIMTKEAQDLRAEEFDVLEAGDVLFIDTTHTVKLDGEVSWLVLEILPRLRSGVYVHFHDIPFPFNFPWPAGYWITSRRWERLDQLRRPMYWTEPVLLQAFLAYNTSFKIWLSLPLLRYYRESMLQARIPGYQTVQDNPNTFSSLWLKKVD